jgi:ABC-type multidrug transport system fused ATPase/permease subunit
LGLGLGKSTLTLALLRLIPLEGSVRISGRDTRRLNLESLRRNVVSIPQEAVLLAGTLRSNLDPFEEYDDADLQDALQISGLGSYNENAGSEYGSSSKLTLESEITSGGSNLSQVSFPNRGKHCLLIHAIAGTTSTCQPSKSFSPQKQSLDSR